MKVTFHGEDLPSSREYEVLGEVTTRWHIAEEVPVAFVYNRRNHAVLMATPDDLVDFALGFSLTENIVRSPDDVLKLDIHQSSQGVDLRFKITNQAIEKFDIIQRRRNLVGSASCGLCGLENVDVLFRKLEPVGDEAILLDKQVIQKALTSLKNHQPLNKLTRTVHAAAWSDMNGSIKIVREDVGRHNALDKLLGALVQERIDKQLGFVVMSSRCSYEIVEKAAMQNVRALTCVSAPTAFALRKAAEANMAIYAQLGQGAVRLL